MNRLALSVLPVLLAVARTTQTAPPPPVRAIHNQTIVSNDLPAADFTLSGSFRYVGAQVVTLNAVADAEQHLFVKTAASGSVEVFCWIQFEHYLPGNNYTYDYKLPGSTDIGGLPFVYDVKSFLDYDQWDAGTDGAAIGSLLAKHNLSFPKRAVQVRMFHLPAPDRRSELMIIYGEALPDDSKIPTTTKGVDLAEASSDAAKLFLSHTKQSLSIRKH